ncbi:two-component system regulatory protein YycI [Bacillus taeanensis]|nr:two-component system regulatory protein YycI [Bacillus taeanensis]
MDWSRTKTIFILTFLVLNLFLGFQLIEKKNENQFDFIPVSSIEEQLKQSKITYKKLSQAPEKLAPISGQVQKFDEEKIKQLEGKNLNIQLIENQTLLTGSFKEPGTMPSTEAQLLNFLQTYTFNSTDYIRWTDHHQENESVILTQTYEGRPIFYNLESKRGQIHLFKNDEGELTGYTQSYLNITKQGNEHPILEPIKALYRLYENNDIVYEDNITRMELGYYSAVEGEIQVFVPTWYIEVNNERSYLVNAVYGLIDKRAAGDKGEKTS